VWLWCSKVANETNTHQRVETCQYYDTGELTLPSTNNKNILNLFQPEPFTDEQLCWQAAFQNSCYTHHKSFNANKELLRWTIVIRVHSFSWAAIYWVVAANLLEYVHREGIHNSACKTGWQVFELGVKIQIPNMMIF